MILYALACRDGHAFDSWFRDSRAFDDQIARNLVTCPVCASADVSKAIMAPAVVGARKALSPSAQVAPERPTPASQPATPEPSAKVALLDERSKDLRALARQVRETLLIEGHDVGRAFAAEARRIHDGDAPHRQIYGQASLTEARDLIEDGIMVLPLPMVPDDLN